MPVPIDNFRGFDDKPAFSRLLNRGAQCAARGLFAPSEEAIS